MPGFSSLSIQTFMDELASKASTPGGGAGAAMGGALAASLVSMVCNLTIGKKGYESAEAVLTDILAESERLRLRLLELADRDAGVYDDVMAAYRLPRDTAQAKSARKAAIQNALYAAALVPLDIAGACAQVVNLAHPAAKLGNRWAVSDAGVAALLAESSVHAALLNVVINLQSIKDPDIAADLSARMDAARKDITEKRDAVLELVNERIRS